MYPERQRIGVVKRRALKSVSRSTSGPDFAGKEGEKSRLKKKNALIRE